MKMKELATSQAKLPILDSRLDRQGLLKNGIILGKLAMVRAIALVVQALKPEDDD